MFIVSQVGVTQRLVGSIWSSFKRVAAAIVSWLAQKWHSFRQRRLRATLPKNLDEWNTKSDSVNGYIRLWDSLKFCFSRHGYVLWTEDDSGFGPSQYISPPSAPGHWFQNPGEPYRAEVRYLARNGRQHALRGYHAKDYMVSVASIAGCGEHSLAIWRRLSGSKPDILSPDNHVLPIVEEIFVEDIVFTVTPMLRDTLQCGISPWGHKSLGDQLHLALQALQAVKYIHSKNIAHRDLFLENFLVEWDPMSMKRACDLKPRVYLIDFETAVEFAPDTPSSERVCNTLPFPEEDYNRPMPRELPHAPLIYCPFALDMWQIGSSLASVLSETDLPSVNAMWGGLCADDAKDRLTAEAAYENVRRLLARIPPEQLHIPSDRD